MQGLVVKNTGSWYVVRTDGGQLFDCKVKGNFRLKDIRSTNPVAVGDYVTIIPGADGVTALIDDIQDRRNCVLRSAGRSLGRVGATMGKNHCPKDRGNGN